MLNCGRYNTYMTETQAEQLAAQIDDSKLENVKHDPDYWCDTIVSHVWLVDDTELSDDEIEAFLSTSTGDLWLNNRIQEWLY